MSLDRLPDGWQIWSDETTKVVLAYRPDVFDSTAFPAPCLPTIYMTKGKRTRRPGQNDPAPDDPWYVTLYLEPEVDSGTDKHESRTAAEDAAVDIATRFDTGKIDYRSLYQVPRPDYFDRLDELTGRET